MKPGNLLVQGAKSGGKRKMRIRYYAHRVLDVRFFLYFDTTLYIKERNYHHGKETVYFRMCYQRPS